MSFWKIAYKQGWASLEMLQNAVALNILTAAEYEEIIGGAQDA